MTSSPGSWSADPHSYGGIAVIADKGGDASPRSFRDVSIEHNAVSDVGRTGIVVWSEDWQRAYSTAVHVGDNTIDHAQGDSIVLLGVDGGAVEHNVSRDGGFLPGCAGCVFSEYNTANAGIWPTRSRNIGIRYNEVSGENDSGGDGEGLDVDESTDHIVVEFNYSHDNRGGGLLLCGASETEVRYNVLRSNGGGELTFSCPVQGGGIRIHHNVIDARTGLSAAIVRTVQGAGTAPILFADNIVCNGSGGAYAFPAAVTSFGNYYCGAAVPSQPGGDGTLQGDWPFAVAANRATGIATLSEYALKDDSPAAGPAPGIDDAGDHDLAANPTRTNSSWRGAIMPSVPATPSR